MSTWRTAAAVAAAAASALLLGWTLGAQRERRGRRRKGLVLPERLRGRVVRSIDCHCAGMPAKVVVAGAPETGGATSALERRQVFMKHHDGFRKLMLQEPRGYPCQNLDVVYPRTPAHPQADFSYVIGENNAVYPAMSGHNTICVCTALLETGMVPMSEPETRFALEAPAGLIRVRAACEGGKARSITLTNCPAFVAALDVCVEVPSLGQVSVDIAWGGMFYAIVDLAKPVNAAVPGLAAIAKLLPGDGGEIVRLGEAIKVATREQHPVKHPEIDYLGPDIMAFRCPPSEEGRHLRGAHARNAVVMSTGKLDWARPATWRGNIDRSPCGTGTCAIMATMYERGELRLEQDFVHESVVGSIFVGRLVEETQAFGRRAVTPTITGSAYITGVSELVVDPEDPFPEGFTVGDLWA